MDSTLYDLRDALMALDDGDRDNLLALIDREEQAQPARTSVEEDAVWLAIKRVTPSASRHYRALSEFWRDKRHGVNRADYGDAVRTVYDLLDEAKPVRHPQQDQAALLELVFECLVKDMNWDKRPGGRVAVTPKSLLQEMPRCRVAVDNCYPGYVQSGMLHRLIRVAATA